MNDDVLVMLILICMGLPLLLGTFLVMHKRGIQLRQLRLQLQLAHAEAKIAKGSAVANDRVEMLEDRLRVVERIVTDGSYETARQIEALRDRPSPADRPADRPVERDKALS